MSVLELVAKIERLLADRVEHTGTSEGPMTIEVVRRLSHEEIEQALEQYARKALLPASC